MVNKEIFKALKNAIDRGDSLEEAIQIAVNSGYDMREVREAASAFSKNGINIQQNPSEELAMPSPRRFFSRVAKSGIREPPPVPKRQIFEIQPPTQKEQIQLQQRREQPAQTQQFPQVREQLQQRREQPSQTQQFPQVRESPKQMKPLTLHSQNTKTPSFNQDKPKSKEKGWFKEILLLVILLFLIGFLVLTILFKDSILTFFSG